MLVKRSRKRKVKINISIMLAVMAVLSFIAAVSIYFVGSFRNTEREYAVYSRLEEPTLPVIYADVDGSYVNVMHGYMQDMGNRAASDSITPLPENRHLGIKLQLYGNVITELSYEIRSLDLEHYIEKTVLTTPTTDAEGNAYAELPIQNMIEKDTPYLLRIKLAMGEKVVNYYTRIIWGDNDDISKMMQAAKDFTSKTFDYDAARDLAVYLESSESADNSSLANVGIDSSFSQITWGNSDMRLASELQLTIKEYSGMMGAVEIKYQTESDGIDTENPDTYENTDEFTMRVGNDRVYMMNYRRSTSQVFDGSKHLFAGNRIRLGIISKDKLRTLKTDNGRYIIFKTDKELWSYDQTGKKAVNVFSFRSEKDRLRASYDKFDIKVLSADDEGNIDFAVYGYMNRGRHEGYNGISCYRFDNSTQTIEEIFFIPIADNYEEISLELDELCEKSSSGTIYIKQQGAIYAIDGTAQEILTLASGLSKESNAVSANQTRIAWIEGDADSTNSIKLTNLETGSTETINAESGTVLSIIGFCNNDLIYGERAIGDNMTVGGRIKGRPVYALHIVDAELDTIMDYRRDGLYFSDITIDGDRIHLAQYRKQDADGTYNFVSRDTIVSSEPEQDHYTQYIASSVSDTKKMMYYVELDESIRATRSLSVTTPQRISYEKTGSLNLQNTAAGYSADFYAYANGTLLGRYEDLSSAIDRCYDGIGWVSDSNCAILYNRADRESAHTIKEPYSIMAAYIAAAKDGTLALDVTDADGYMVLDAQGVELNKLMYYIGKGLPVMAATEDGGYCLLCSYDRTSVGIYYPADNEEQSTKVSMTLEEAAQYFARSKNDFICLVKYPGR